MKFLVLLLSLFCAALLSVLAALYASGRLEKKEEPEPVVVAEVKPEVRSSMFPEQSRAVEELMKAIVARQEAMGRQETLLNDREEQIKQEMAVLNRMRDELALAQKEIDAYFGKVAEMSQGWDDDERKNMRKLSEFYAKMDPQNAAKLLSKIEPARVARILNNLSDRQAAAIMDATVALGPNGIELAVKWTELIRQMKEPQKTSP